MKVIAYYDPPPIPDRRWDWKAYDFDNYDPGQPIGYGPTEEAAIADFWQFLKPPDMKIYLLWGMGFLAGWCLRDLMLFF